MFLSPPDFQPDFNKGNGLVAAIAQDKDTREVLMLAWMDEEAWLATLATGKAHYHSRSRGKLWLKGESSGNVQHVHAVRLDCDSDAVLLLVEQVGGAACHEGYASCFFRELRPSGPNAAAQAVRLCCARVLDPKDMYK